VLLSSQGRAIWRRFRRFAQGNGHKKRPSLAQHKGQPRSGDLRSDGGSYNEGRVELRTDDAGVEDDTSQHDARASARVRGNGKIDQVQSAKSRKARGKRNGKYLQAQPVNEIQNIALVFGTLNEAGRKWQASDDCIAENDSGEYFAHDLRLPHLYEQPAQQLGKTNQKQE
jgi:hypothetical protein